MKHRRLGRGLSALIRETTDETIRSDSILHVPIDLITPNPLQPRQDFDSENAKLSLEELANSIKEKGIIQSITVRSAGEGYELIAGERRWRAARMAGLTEIPVHIIDITNDVEMVEYALIENIQRENLNIIEEAEAYATLNSKFSLSHMEIATAVGKSRVAISNTLRLLKLPSNIKNGLRENKITAGHARALLGLKIPKYLDSIYNRIVKNNESVRAVEVIVAKLNEDGQKEKSKQRSSRRVVSPEIQKIEDDLFHLLEAKVEVNHKGQKGGVIKIHYFNDDDLNRLIDLMFQIET